jgi:hypothetical protein
MKDTVREMIKNVIEENAVSFKETTSRVLLNKVGNSLSEKYIKISQQLFTEENAAPKEVDVAAIEKINPNNPVVPNQRQSATGTDLPYDPSDPFWQTENGRQFMIGWNYLTQNYRNATKWNFGGLPFMNNPTSLLAWLRGRANEFGVGAPPWNYPIPNLPWGGPGV